MFNFLRRLFGGASGQRHPESKPVERAGESIEGRPNPAGEPSFAEICGPPEANTPIVLVSLNDGMMILDRMAYEYQRGMTTGDDPSQRSIDRVLRGATRVRAFDGGMLREDSLGTNVLIEEEDPVSIRELIDALRIVEDPTTFHHCACLGEPTLEFFDDDELIATIAIHHGKAIRWAAWKHDAVLESGRYLANWMASRGIELGDAPRNPEDVMMMGLLSMKPAGRFAARAWSYLQHGAPDRSLMELDRAEEADRGEGVVPALRAEAYFRLGRFDEGRAEAEEALGRGYRDANVLRTLAACLDALGRPEEGLARSDEAVALDPENAMARNSRGFILGRLGRLDEARDDFAEAARLAPDWVLPAFQLAMLEFERGNSAIAVDWFARAIEILESSGVPPRERVLGYHSIATLHSLRASCRIAMGDPEGGRRDADQAIALDPDEPNGYFQRGRALGMMGQIPEAVDDFETLARIAPDHPHAWIFLAQARAQSGDLPGALEAIGEGMRLDPENPHSFSFRGSVLMQLGRWEEAREDMTEAIRIRPDEATNYLLRAQSSRRLGDYGGGLEDLRTARRWSPDDPGILNSLAWLLATCPVDSLRDGPLAESLAMRAADLTGGRQSEVVNTLAAALAENGKFAEARERLRQSIELAPPGYNAEEREAMRRAFDEDRPFREGP
jgi:tetratricopeptide (TPR) repeat protein